MNTSMRLKIINKLSDDTNSIILMNWLDNYKKYIEYNEWAYKIISNKDISDIIRKFIGYEKTIDIIQSIIEGPLDEVSLSDIQDLINIPPAIVENKELDNHTDQEEYDEYNDPEAYDEYNDTEDIEGTLDTLNTEHIGFDNQINNQPRLTQEQLDKLLQVSDVQLQDLSKTNAIEGLSDNATDELGEVVDTSYLPKVIPDVDELTQAIVVRNKAIFESCLQLDRPYGMLYNKGMLSYAIIDGKVMYRGGENRGGRSLFEKLYNAIIEGTRANIRCAKDLRNVPNYDNLEQSNYNYYPGFMFKYALGIVNGVPYKAWGKFEKALRDNINDKLRKLYTKEDLFFANIEKIEQAFCTSILILSYEPGTGIKLRLSLPGNKIDQSRLEKSICSIQTFRNSSITILNISDNEDVADIQILQDEDKYLNRPYWAYQAMEVKINNGEAISLSGGLPIGRKANGEIIDFKLDPSSRFINFLAAGSGSGKGVMTLSIVAAALGSGIPIMYIDFKPDMAEIFWKLEQQYNIKTFTYDAMGVNRRDTEFARDFKDTIPEAIKGELEQYASVIFYMKAVQLMCAIAQYRSEHGFEKEIMFIFDETQALQKQVAPLVNKLNTIKKQYTKAKDTTNEVYLYCEMLLDWLKNVNSNIDTYVNTTGRKSSTFTLFIAQSPDYTTWNDMIAKSDDGTKLQLLSRITFSDTIFKMLGKGSTTSKYGLGGEARKTIDPKELKYVANNRFFGMYDGKTTDGADITIFKPFLTLNYDDPFEKCWYNGLGKSFGAGDVPDEEYINNILTEHMGKDNYKNEYGIHTGTGLLGLTSMYCQGDIEKVKEGLSSGLEYVKDFFNKTGLSGKYTEPEDYLFDLSYDGLMLIGNMTEYNPAKENSALKGTGTSEQDGEESNNEIYAGFEIPEELDTDAELDEQDTDIDTDNIIDNINELDSEYSEEITEIDEDGSSAINLFNNNIFDEQEIQSSVLSDFQFEDSLFGDADRPVKDAEEDYKDFAKNFEQSQENTDQNSINQDDINQDGINQDSINQNGINQNSINQDSINQDSINQDTTSSKLDEPELISLEEINKLLTEEDNNLDEPELPNKEETSNEETKSTVTSGESEQIIRPVQEYTEPVITHQDSLTGEEEIEELDIDNNTFSVDTMIDNNLQELDYQKVQINQDQQDITQQNEYRPPLVDTSLIAELESDVIESIDPNLNDYLGAVTRLILNRYKTGKVNKEVAETVAIKMGLKENGYLKSYDFSTADNYIGPKPERMQVQLMEMNQVGTKRVNNQTIVDTSMIDPQNQVILNNDSIIKCGDLNKGTAKIFKNFISESPDTILASSDSMWRELLLTCKRQIKDIDTVELVNGEMRVNKKMLNLNGIIHNDNYTYDSITLASIVSFSILFNYLQGIKTLVIDEQMLEMGYIEFGRSVIKEMFTRGKALRLIVIQQSNGSLKKITKPDNQEYEQDQYVDNEIDQRADRVNFRINCYTRRNKNFINQSYSDKILNTKMSMGKNDNADKLPLERPGGIKTLIGKIGKKLVTWGS